jgi:hypothetical protein
MIAPASTTKHIQLYVEVKIVEGIWHGSVGTLD